MDFVILGGALLIGFIFGWNARERRAMNSLRKYITAMEEQEANKEGDYTAMRLERHGEIVYAFTEEDNSFIAQGTDVYELDEAIKARFPEQKFKVKEDNLKEVGLTL